MPQSILYYPTIDIQDGPWLRSAALYWDEVCSIVPYEGYTDFSPEVAYLQDYGHYRPIYPQSFLNSEFASDFLDDLEKRIKRLNQNHRELKTDIHTKIHVNKVKGLSRDKLPYCFSEKICELQGLQNNLPEWIEIDSAIASVYIRTLAEYAAKYDSNNVLISTDSKSELNHIYQRTKRIDDNSVIALSLIQCLPVPNMTVGFEDILHFKETRKNELFYLRQKIQKLEMDLSHSESLEEFKIILSDFKDSWGREIEKATKMFGGDGIPFLFGSLKSLVVDAGGVAGLITALQPNGISPLIVGATAGVTGIIGVSVEYRKHKEKIKQCQRENGFAYLISASKYGII